MPFTLLILAVLFLTVSLSNTLRIIISLIIDPQRFRLSSSSSVTGASDLIVKLGFSIILFSGVLGIAILIYLSYPNLIRRRKKFSLLDPNKYSFLQQKGEKLAKLAELKSHLLTK